MRFDIVHLNENDDYGVYCAHMDGKFGTPMVFRGSKADADEYANRRRLQWDKIELRRQPR